MSCKEKPNPSKSKHYTTIEKKVFLHILQDYKYVIEVKKSDSATLKEKDVVCSEICTKYNQSTLICQERTIQQLKKLWMNMKQSQREALTKEKQSRMATGGGPLETEANIDPDIINIVPHLMKTAPVLFTSNMTEAEINDKRDLAFECISSHPNIEVLDIESTEFFTNKESDIEITSVQGVSTIGSQSNKESTTSCNLKILEEPSDILGAGKIETATGMKQKKRKILKLSDMEEELKIKRIQRIIDEEQKLANVKLKHEETMANMKEEHLKKVNYMQLQHLKEIQKIEIQINKAKLMSMECQSIENENIDPRL